MRRFADDIATYRYKAVRGRSIDELIGICKGVIADGIVCQTEAEYLLNWMQANTHAADGFPARVLYPRIAAMLCDGHLDSAEAQELMHILQSATGERGQAGKETLATSLAYDSPLPDLVFAEQKFCLTGDFAYGFRSDVEKRTLSLGGMIVKSVLKKGCILIVGYMGSENWLHSTHGRKISEAVAARDDGRPVSVVPEEHWNLCCEKMENGHE